MTTSRGFSFHLVSCIHVFLQSQYDTPLLELISIENEIKLAIAKLSHWAAPRPVEKNLLTISDEAYIKPEPLGVVLIIGAWNYPWAVTLLPLVGAIAAGREVFLSPVPDYLCLTLLHIFFHCFLTFCLLLFLCFCKSSLILYRHCGVRVDSLWSWVESQILCGHQVHSIMKRQRVIIMYRRPR